jgi:hypothetical protein
MESKFNTRLVSFHRFRNKLRLISNSLIENLDVLFEFGEGNSVENVHNNLCIIEGNCVWLVVHDLLLLLNYTTQLRCRSLRNPQVIGNLESCISVRNQKCDGIILIVLVVHQGDILGIASIILCEYEILEVPY